MSKTKKDEKKYRSYDAQVARGQAMCSLIENNFPSLEAKSNAKWDDALLGLVEIKSNALRADEAGVTGEARAEIILTGTSSSATQTAEIIGVLNGLADAVTKLSARLDVLEQRQQPKQQQPKQQQPQQQQRKRKRKRNRKGQQGQNQNQTP